MNRLVIETGLLIALLVLGLEVIHYRNAVLDCHVEEKRAWKTVVELREQNETLQKPLPRNATRVTSRPSNP